MSNKNTNCWRNRAVRKEAFLYYCELGKDRTTKAVAEKFGYAVRTVNEWRRVDSWDQQVLDTVEKDPVKQKAKYRGLIAQLVYQAAEDIQAGNIQVTTVDELEKLTKLDMLLAGGCTDRVASDQKVDFSVKCTENTEKQ